jgi:ABC-type multidrug transport system fused ATPase/permease subunit
MLCGLHEPTHGLVQINGIDVRDLSLGNLRDSVSLVGSTNEVFAGTIEENILMGRINISHQDLQWAIGLAQLNEELASFPKGLRHNSSRRVGTCRAGSCSESSIARAIINRPQLLILDEGFDRRVDENLFPRWQSSTRLFEP